MKRNRNTSTIEGIKPINCTDVSLERDVQVEGRVRNRRVDIIFVAKEDGT